MFLAMSNSPPLAPLSGRKERGRRFTRCACVRAYVRCALADEADRYFHSHFENSLWLDCEKLGLILKAGGLGFGPSHMLHLNASITSLQADSYEALNIYCLFKWRQ